MSMLSAQCDELRELAGDGSMEWVAGPVRASVLREAADTILGLRDDLQRANAENAKLRKFATETWELLTCNEPIFVWKGLREKARELGVEVEP